MFILITDSQGQQTIIRGGPEKEGMLHMLMDDLKIVKQPYQANLEPLFPNDYFSPNKLPQLPHITIATGTDAEINAYVEKMWQRAQEINEGNYDYKFSPFCGAPWCAQQNSNTVIKDLTETAGLKFQLPKYANGQNVWAPGWRGTIEHTLGDKISKYIMYDDTELPNIHAPNIRSLDDEFSTLLDVISEPNSQAKASFAEGNERVFGKTTSAFEVDNAQRLKDIGEKLKAKGYESYADGFSALADVTNLGVDIADMFLRHNDEEQRDEL
jgi:hypothetical protein